jgi:hypothetical protein
MARVISHRKNPRGGPRPSQPWALVDPRLLELLKRNGAIREADVPPPAPKQNEEPAPE